MSFPFISRTHHEDVVSLKDVIIANRDATIREMSRELHRLHDLIYKVNFGVQIHDTIPVAQAEPEPTLTAEQQLEQEHQQEVDYRNARLTSIARTRPSQLAGELSKEMVQENLRRAQAANPGIKREVRQVFAAAHTEATKA